MKIFLETHVPGVPYRLGEGEVVNYLIEKYGNVLTLILS